MTNMQDREKAFEAKFALDEELRFKAEARRNKLLGFWAAGLMGKSDAGAYANEVVASDFEEVGHEDVVRSSTRESHRSEGDAGSREVSRDEGVPGAVGSDAESRIWRGSSNSHRKKRGRNN